MTLSRLFRFALPVVALCAASMAQAQVRERPLRDGDRVLVKIWADTVFADTARVQQNQQLVLPRIGMLSIAGLTTSQMQDSVRSAFARLIREAPVEVTALRRITVIGEVGRPGVYFMETHADLRDAIALAGGIGGFGITSRITLLRDSTRARIRGWQERTGGEAAIQSGDILIVDRESWVKRNAFTVVSGTSVLVSIILALTQR